MAHQVDPDCSIHGEGAQPLPVATSHPVAHRMVQDDLEARLEVGVKHGPGGVAQALRMIEAENAQGRE